MQSLLFETAPEPTIDLPGHPSVFSPCQGYRYTLWRVWNAVEKPRLVMWILLHPLSAEADDEAAIVGCVNDSRACGFDGMCVCNLFAFRAAHAEAMKAQRDAVGDDNDYWLVQVAEHASGSSATGALTACISIATEPC